MATVNVTKYNPMEMLNKAFNFADWAVNDLTLDGTEYHEIDTTGAREIHIIQKTGFVGDTTIKFKNEAGIYPEDDAGADYEFTLKTGNLPFVADKMQMDAISIKGLNDDEYIILWYK